MIKFTIAGVLAFMALTVLTLGTRGRRSERPPLEFFQDMVVQSKYKPQQASRFFSDRRTDRLPPTGTVPWGRQGRAPEAQYCRSDADDYAMAEIPLTLDRALLQRGLGAYDTFCRVCHGGTGAGNGITTEYGMINPPSYHSDRLVNIQAGEILRTITEGKGQMGPYGSRLDRLDRWAVVAYIRALQRAHRGTLQDVPESERQSLLQP